MADRKDPYRKFRFRLEIDGITQAGFSEVSGFDASVDVVEYRTGNDLQLSARKLPGLTKYGNVTFKWGMTDSLELYNWMTALTRGTDARKNITVVLMNGEGQDAAAWQIINALPSKYSAPDFSATSSEVGIETLEVAHEGMTRRR